MIHSGLLLIVELQPISLQRVIEKDIFFILVISNNKRHIMCYCPFIHNGSLVLDAFYYKLSLSFFFSQISNILIVQWPNAVYEAVCGGDQETRGPPWTPGRLPLHQLSDVRIVRVWSACRPTHVHYGPTIIPAWAFAHQIIATTAALHRTLLHQGSQPTWVKKLRRPKKPPQTSNRPSLRLSYTKMHQSSHP